MPFFTPTEKRTWQDKQITTLEDKSHNLLTYLAIIDLQIKTRHLYDTYIELKNEMEDFKKALKSLTEILTKFSETHRNDELEAARKKSVKLFLGLVRLLVEFLKLVWF